MNVTYDSSQLERMDTYIKTVSGDTLTLDTELLQEGLSHNAEEIFNIANRYFGASQIPKAIQLHTRRIHMGGWDQEIFMSIYNLGLCYKRTGNISQFISTMLDAWNYRATRVEPLFQLIDYYTHNRSYLLAQLYYDKAITIPLSDDVLCIEEGMYGHKLDYLYTLFAYYCNITKEVYKSFARIFNCPQYRIENILRNYKCYVPILNTQTSIDIGRFCDLRLEEVTNPTIIEDANGYLVNICVHKKNNPSVAIHKCLSMDKEFNIISTHTFDYTSDVKCLSLTRKEGRIWFIDEINSSNDYKTIQYGEYNNTLRTLMPMKYIQYTGKTLTAIPYSDSIIDNWYPLSICNIVKTEENNYKTVKHIEKKMPYMFSHVKGKTCGCRYKDELWFVVQYIYSFQNDPAYYFISIVVMDTQYNFKWTSYPFKLNSASIGSCLGIIVNEETIILSHSKSYIYVLNKDVFIHDLKMLS